MDLRGQWPRLEIAKSHPHCHKSPDASGRRVVEVGLLWTSDPTEYGYHHTSSYIAAHGFRVAFQWPLEIVQVLQPSPS